MGSSHRVLAVSGFLPNSEFTTQCSSHSSASAVQVPHSPRLLFPLFPLPIYSLVGTCSVGGLQACLRMIHLSCLHNEVMFIGV